MKIMLSSLFILVIISSCSTKSNVSTEVSNEWKELDSFHMIMAESFHPYMDSANLAPAKSLADELAIEAEKWIASELPEKVRNDKMRLKMQMLSVYSQTLLQQVNENAPDSLVGQSLTDLHNTFHEIQEGWYKGGEHHH